MHLIEFGGFLFWTFIIGIVVCDIVFLEKDSGWGTFCATAIGGFALWYLGGAANPFPWIRDHWATILMVGISYIFFGACWGIIKWWFYLHNRADDYEAQRDARQKEYARVYEHSDADDPTKPSYKDWLSRNYKFPPSPTTHKADITMWMVWWPISGFWTLLNDPLKRIYRLIYQHLVSTYTRMASAVFGGRFSELK